MASKGMIAYFDYRPGYESQREEFDDAIARVLASGKLILGEEVEAFEEEFADGAEPLKISDEDAEKILKIQESILRNIQRLWRVSVKKLEMRWQKKCAPTVASS